MAIVGQVGDTMYFRNAKRHIVKTDPEIITLRVDGSLYFANARALETKVFDLVAKQPRVKNFILMCSSVNEIDASALESLEAINERLDEMGVKFHMSAIKDQVMDRLLLTHFFRDLTGKAFSTQYEAFTRLRAQTPDPEILKASKGAQAENKGKEQAAQH